jgi:hypothetical protein
MAEADPSEVRRMLGGLPSFADVESWIEQAAELAEHKQAQQQKNSDDDT